MIHANETPRHPEYLSPFALGSRLVTNAEYLEFIDDRGYARPELWLSDGWATAAREGWEAPLYWERRDGEWLPEHLVAQIANPEEH